MRISSINNSVSFGYDKTLNNELKTRLNELPDRQWAATLSSMNKSCNSIESKLRKYDKKSKDSRYQDYLDLFLSMKNALVGFITITFDDFKFADREYKHYQDEFEKQGKSDDAWQKDACNAILEWTENIPLYPENFGPPPVKKDEKKDEQVVAGSAKKQLLELYTPSESSPKGFSDVAGLSDIKRDLNEDIITYLKNPELIKTDFDEYGIKMPTGILLYGPPGCGKTYITQALSAEAGVPLYMLNISNAGSQYINLTSKNIQRAFDDAVKIAKSTGKPCLLFMDEIDTLGFDRNSRTDNEDMKQVGTLLQALDSAKDNNVIVIGATNKYNLLDPAIKRRLECSYFVDLPDDDARLALLIKNLSSVGKGKKLLESTEDLQKIVKLLAGYSNSSICIISSNAAKIARRRNRDNITVDDYIKSVEISNQEKPNRKDYLPDSLNKHRMGF